MISPEEFAPFPAENYDSIDLNRLAVFGIATLQERAIPTSFENIVVALFKLFPTKFHLVGFSSYPDAARINRALLQLQPKYRNWARGSVHKGFILTESGKAVVEQTRALLRAGTPVSRSRMKRVSPRPRTRDPQTELIEIEGSEMFKLYQAGRQEDVEKNLIWELLHAYPYTPKKALKQRMKLLENMAENAKRDDIKTFLEWVISRFGVTFQAE